MLIFWRSEKKLPGKLNDIKYGKFKYNTLVSFQNITIFKGHSAHHV